MYVIYYIYVYLFNKCVHQRIRDQTRTYVGNHYCLCTPLTTNMYPVSSIIMVIEFYWFRPSTLSPMKNFPVWYVFSLLHMQSVYPREPTFHFFVYLRFLSNNFNDVDCIGMTDAWSFSGINYVDKIWDSCMGIMNMK